MSCARDGMGKIIRDLDWAEHGDVLGQLVC
jgi:hypothetical protein